MLPFKIGNWIINEDGICHQNCPDPEYIITPGILNQAGPQERSKMYDFMVHLPIKRWVSVEDIYTFNTALIFALEHFNIGFSDKLSFVDTIREQQGEIEIKIMDQKRAQTQTT